MQNEILEQKMRLFESFVEVFAQFWRDCAKTQAYNQLIGALEMQTSAASSEKKEQLEVFLGKIKEKHEKQIAEVFNSLLKLSGKGATDFSAPCADMLTNATNTITIDFASVVGQFDDLTYLFLGDEFCFKQENGDADE